ncbi:MAG TPA: T9SS type A sorting domain-containing protein [Bacteroidota bacterium]|nr:T9SS type A sorting domain-containing protein [Bacteroidota bacterium]
MKPFVTKLRLVVVLAAMCTEAMAATISGTISYTGTSTGEVLVALYPDTTFSGKPSIYITMNETGSYSLTGISDGTYYVVSLMTKSLDSIQMTDPWGGYRVSGKLTPVVIAGANNATGINITLVDGTQQSHNPFSQSEITPDRTIQLSDTTLAGNSPTLAYDGSSIYLYKHDSTNAEGAKIYKIDPSSGTIQNVFILSLQSLPNRISWIECLVFHNSVLWATGGYGDPSGSGYIRGVFKIDIASSSSSNQIRIDSTIGMTLENGLASDGTNLYVAIDSGTVHGIKKFNPDQSSTLPASLSYRLNGSVNSLSYGAGHLWAQTMNIVENIDPATGNVVANYNIPTANLYINNMLWGYDENKNAIQEYTIASATGIKNNGQNLVSQSYELLQNYPNPFNPSTFITYQVPKASHVTLRVFDILGREVAVLVNEVQSAGTYKAVFDAQHVSSGVYFYQIKAGSFLQTKKMVLIK